MSTGHKIIKCRKCKIVLGQCRCMFCNKTVEYTLCKKCAEENK
jgi:hypothetical protein